MELYWNKDPKIATNVFELGLKTFGNEPEYVIQYLDFLIKSNNDSSTSPSPARAALTVIADARALFERTVAKVEPAKARLLWDRWAQYEYQYGDFASAQKLFQRYSDAFPEGTCLLCASEALTPDQSRRSIDLLSDTPTADWTTPSGSTLAPRRTTNVVPAPRPPSNLDRTNVPPPLIPSKMHRSSARPTTALVTSVRSDSSNRIVTQLRPPPRTAVPDRTGRAGEVERSRQRTTTTTRDRGDADRSRSDAWSRSDRFRTSLMLVAM